MMDKLIDIKNSLNDRILTNITFNENSFEMKLNDIVFLYNDGRNWKVIPLKVTQMYPIIYDLYYENENAIPITIYVCPYTLFSCIYFEEMLSYDKVYNNNLVLMNKKNNDMIIIPILNNIYSVSTQTLQEKYIRKNEIKAMTIRNAISLYPDSQFINMKDIKPKASLVDNTYLSDNTIMFDIEKPPLFTNHHPKTLIYIVEYKSKTTHKYKYTVVIPKKNTFDRVKNGMHKYLDVMNLKITEKGGIIYSCLWFAWICTFPSSRIIKL